MSLQIGDKVNVHDGSWSYSFSDNGFQHECGINLKGTYEVLAVGVQMPFCEGYSNPELCMDHPDSDLPNNDTLIRDIATGKVISIQERMLTKIEPPKADPPAAKPKYAVGDKVVPISKSIWPNSAPAWDLYRAKGQPFLYVTTLNPNLGDYGLSEEEGSNASYDYYLESDLTPYVEPTPEVKAEPEPTPTNLCPEAKTITELSISYKFAGAETTCIIQTEEGLFIGKAKCNPADAWSEKTGRDLAYLRAHQKEIKADIKRLKGI